MDKNRSRSDSRDSGQQQHHRHSYGIPSTFESAAVHSSLANSYTSQPLLNPFQSSSSRQTYLNYRPDEYSNQEIQETYRRERESYHSRPTARTQYESDHHRDNSTQRDNPTIQQDQINAIKRAQEHDAAVQAQQIRDYQINQYELARYREQQQQIQQEFEYEQNRNYEVESKFRKEQQYYEPYHYNQQQESMDYTPTPYNMQQNDYFEPNSQYDHHYAPQYQQPVFVPDNSPPPLLTSSYSPHPTEYQQIALQEKLNRDYREERELEHPEAYQRYYNSQRNYNEIQSQSSNQRTNLETLQQSVPVMIDSVMMERGEKQVSPIKRVKKASSIKSIKIKAPPTGLVRPRVVVPAQRARSRSISPIPYFAIERKRQLRSRIPSAPQPITTPIIPLKGNTNSNLPQLRSNNKSSPVARINSNLGKTIQVIKKKPVIKRVPPLLSPVITKEEYIESTTKAKKILNTQLPSPALELEKVFPVNPIIKPRTIEVISSLGSSRPRPSYAPLPSDSEESYIDPEEELEELNQFNSDVEQEFKKPTKKIKLLKKKEVIQSRKMEPSGRIPRMETSKESPEGSLYSTRIKPFIAKLTFLLTNPKTYGTIIRWDSTGNQIIINLNEIRLIEEILPKFYSHKSPAAFQRQLNVYGFVRITHEALEQVVKATEGLDENEFKKYVGYQHDTYDRNSPLETLEKYLPMPSKARLAKSSAKKLSSSPTKFNKSIKKLKIKSKSFTQSTRKIKTRAVKIKFISSELEQDDNLEREEEREISIAESSPLTEVEDFEERIEYESEPQVIRISKKDYSVGIDDEESSNSFKRRGSV